MRQIIFTNKFKKSMKDVKNYKSYKVSELEAALATLAEGGKLPENMRDHALSKSSPGYLNDARAFHLRPDIAVIYKMNDDELQVLNIGQHNKTKLTASYQK